MKVLISLCLIVISSSELCSAYRARDYCHPKLCQYSPNEKIACGNYERVCPGGQIVHLSKSDKNFIVEKHNELRNKIASGKLSGFGKAARMASMQWDDELAYLAELNANRCLDKHDCHNFPKYPKSGQNIAYSWEPPNRQVLVTEYASGATTDWFEEYHGADNENMKYFRGSRGRVILHFTGMVHEKNNRVGCAFVHYPELLDGVMGSKYIFVCNYAYMTMLNQPVYTQTSGVAGSNCKTGRNRKYTALCSDREQYDVKN